MVSQELIMSSDASQPPTADRSVLAALLPIMTAVFVAFLVTGLAMGAYTAFLDLALGLANPVLGLVAGGFGLGAVFLTSALVVMCSVAVAVQLLNTRHVQHASGLKILT